MKDLAPVIDRLRKLFPQREDAARISPLAPMPAVSIEQFMELTRLFPIGSRINYCPKGQASLSFSTLLIGYRVNGVDLYSGADFEINSNGQGPQLILHASPTRDPLAVIESLSFLAPCDQQDVSRLDYSRREELEQISLTEAGALLTLLGQTVGRRTPSIDARLDQTQRLVDGVFANQSVSVFAVNVERLNFYDQRTFYRIETCYPAELQPATGGDLIACDIRDFSENAAKIELISAADVPENLWEGRRVILSLMLGERPLHLQGRVMRRDASGYLVMRLESIQQGDEFIPLSNLEAIGIKSQLLQATANLNKQSHPDG